MLPEELFQSWLSAHRGIIEKVVRAHGRGDAERDDLRQEVLYQLWCSVPRFAGQSAVSTWIYRVALNTALTWRRTVGRREKRFEAVPDPETIVGGEAGPAVRAEQEDLLAGLYSALRELPAGDRTLLLLSLDGLAYREIAEVTGMTENHVGVALTRARARLAAQMKEIRHELV